jgi:tRNA nucleotidyltransferase (CCA-adding enzyme)
MNKFDFGAIPLTVLHICETLRARGHKAWIVGGCVRDGLMGRRVADWDLATTATPDFVNDTFAHVIATGEKHGTVTVMSGGCGYEITTLRGEGDYTDGRRPDSVTYVDDIRIDLARRDFTMNAIAIDPLTREFIDPFGGVDDIERRLIRAVGDPALRFQEDGLRAMRAVRFMSTLEFNIDPDTIAAIPDALDTFAKVSVERTCAELTKILESNKPSRGLLAASWTGLLRTFAPELYAGDDGYFQLMCKHLDGARGKYLVFKLAVLTLDLGHEGAGEFLRRLRFPNNIVNAVEHLVKCARFDYDGERWRADYYVKKWLRVVGPERYRDVIELVLLDAPPHLWVTLSELVDRCDQILNDCDPLYVSDLKVSGADLIKEVSVAPGIRMGVILDYLLEAALSAPWRNTREELMPLAHDYHRLLPPDAKRLTFDID